MAKRQRRPISPEPFEDPLSNYEGPDYADEFERSLCEGQVSEIEHRPFLAVLADETVRATVTMMAEKDIACVVAVNEAAEPVGIFSERDVLERVSDRYAEVADGPISAVMTHDPVVVYDTDLPAKVLNVMASGGFRHVPVVDADGRLTGVIGARRVTAYLQRYFPDVTGR